MSRKSTTNTRRLECFHASTVENYQVTRNLWEQVVARELSIEAVQHQVHTLQTRLGALRSESKLLAWFQRAYGKLPLATANRLITSHHGAALDAMASFVGFVADKVGHGDARIGASGAPPGSSNCCDPVRLAELAVQFRALGGLPAFDAEFQSRLVAEFNCARALPRKRKPGRAAQVRRLKYSRAENVLDKADKTVLAICNSSRSANEKMRRICRVDRRFLGWTSTCWAPLLGTTDSAVRQTVTWKKIRAATPKRGKQVPLDDR